MDSATATFNLVGLWSHNMLDKMIRYESGEMTSDLEVIDLFQELIDTGVIWELQGHYQRTALQLIESGDCHKQEN